jgi:hypothetical protein
VTIWKYTLETVDLQWIEMPAGARLLCVQMQHGKPQLWALVDPAGRLCRRLILTTGTGQLVRHLADSGGVYCGTYQLADGNLVFHVFGNPEKER